jgi:hypothetical protein
MTDRKNFSPPSRQERQGFRATENLSSLVFLGGNYSGISKFVTDSFTAIK